MSTVYDQFMNGAAVEPYPALAVVLTKEGRTFKEYCDDFGKLWSRAIPEAVHFQIHNIRDFLLSQGNRRIFFGETGGEEILELLRPPFPACWFEWRIATGTSIDTSIGALGVECTDPEDGHISLHIHPFGKSRDGIMVFPPCFVQLDEHGRNRGIEYVADREITTTLPALLAIHLCHWPKDVVIDTHEPNARVNRKREARGDEPLVTYRTISIQGWQHKLEACIREAGTGESTVRYHRVRGNFATYTAERPRFGQPDGVGVFFRRAHYAGDPALGITVADYKMGVPKP
jgi:hypothetical protein